MDANAPAVSIDRLTKRYGEKAAVDNLTLNIPQGQIFGLLGANGAGKTTTLEVLATIRQPTSGTARVAGHDVTKAPMEARRGLAILLDAADAPRPSWTITEYLSFFAGLRGDPPPTNRILKLLELADLHDKPTGKLSAGQRRRVELARVLGANAHVLMLDEPTKELDLKGKRIVWDAIRREARARGATVILSSHDVHEIRTLCDAVAVLRDGRLAETFDRAYLRAHDTDALEAALREALG